MKGINDLTRRLEALEKKGKPPPPRLPLIRPAHFDVDRWGAIRYFERSTDRGDFLQWLIHPGEEPYSPYPPKPRPDNGKDLHYAINEAGRGSEKALYALCDFAAFHKNITRATKYVSEKLGVEAARNFKKLIQPHGENIKQLIKERKKKRARHESRKSLIF